MGMRYIPGSGVDPTPYTSKVPNYDVFGPLSAAFDTLFEQQMARKQLAEQARQADMGDARGWGQIDTQRAGQAAQQAQHAQALGWDRSQQIAKRLADLSSAISANSPDAAAAARAELARLGATPEEMSGAEQSAPKPPSGPYAPPPELGAPQPPPMAPPPPGTPPAGDDLGVTHGRMPKPGASLDTAPPLGAPQYRAPGGGAPLDRIEGGDVIPATPPGTNRLRQTSLPGAPQALPTALPNALPNAPPQLGSPLTPPPREIIPAPPPGSVEGQAPPRAMEQPPAQLGGPLAPPSDPATAAANTVFAEVQRSALAAGLKRDKAADIARAAAQEAYSTTALDGKAGVSRGEREKRGIDRGVELIKATQRPVLQGIQIQAGVTSREDQQAHQRELQDTRLATAGERRDFAAIDRHVKDMAAAKDWKRINETDRNMDLLDSAIAKGDVAAVKQAVTVLMNPGGGALSNQDQNRWADENPDYYNRLKTLITLRVTGKLPPKYVEAVQAWTSHVRDVQSARAAEMETDLAGLIQSQFGDRGDLFDYALAKARSMVTGFSKPAAKRPAPAPSGSPAATKPAAKPVDQMSDDELTEGLPRR